MSAPAGPSNTQELFRQGDRERALGLPVSALMDRSQAGVTRSQEDFFGVIAKPLFSAWVDYFPGCQPLLDALNDNLEMWREDERARAAAAGQ